MILADLVFSTEAEVVVGGLLLSLSGAIGVIFKLYVASKDRHLAGVEIERDSYRNMANEAVTNLETAVEKFLADDIKRVPRLAPVVPEHQSPTTPQARVIADIATLRARAVAAALALGLKPPPLPQS